MNEVQASSKAKLLAAINMNMSLLRMERVPKVVMSVLHSGFASGPPRHRDDLSADLESSLRSRFQIHYQPYLVPLDDEGDHSASLDKSVAFAHGQHICSSQFLEDLCRTFLFRRTHEHNLTTLEILVLSEVLDQYGPPIDRLSGCGVCQESAEWIGSDDSQYDGGAGVGKGLRGPLHELGEVIKETGFDLIFGQSLGLCHLRTGWK